MRVNRAADHKKTDGNPGLPGAQTVSDQGVPPFMHHCDRAGVPQAGSRSAAVPVPRQGSPHGLLWTRRQWSWKRQEATSEGTSGEVARRASRAPLRPLHGAQMGRRLLRTCASSGRTDARTDSGTTWSTWVANRRQPGTEQADGRPALGLVGGARVDLAGRGWPSCRWSSPSRPRRRPAGPPGRREGHPRQTGRGGRGGHGGRSGHGRRHHSSAVVVA